MCRIYTIDCATADEFLDALSLRSNYLKVREDIGAWLFRGHGSATWKLTATALRGDGRLELATGKEIKTNRDQVDAELEVVKLFFFEADGSGLHLPEDSQETRKRMHELGTETYFTKLASGDELWPPYSIYTLLAMIQHHGLPTRLLDWTFDPKIAAYFAAEAAATRWQETDVPEMDGSPLLAVWAMSRSALRQYRDDSMVDGQWVPVVEVAAPRAEIPSLQAQNGVFLLHRPLAVALDESLAQTAFEDILPNRSDGFEPYAIVQKFTLPISQSGRLLWLLAIEGVNGSRLFPGYDGAARMVHERQLWRKPVSRILTP
jgi:hypothetical protein